MIASWIGFATKRQSRIGPPFAAVSQRSIVGTTLFVPRGAWCTCAVVTSELMLENVIVQQTSSRFGLNVMYPVPLPSGSDGVPVAACSAPDRLTAKLTK